MRGAVVVVALGVLLGCTKSHEVVKPQPAEEGPKPLAVLIYQDENAGLGVIRFCDGDRTVYLAYGPRKAGLAVVEGCVE